MDRIERSMENQVMHAAETGSGPSGVWVIDMWRPLPIDSMTIDLSDATHALIAVPDATQLAEYILPDNRSLGRHLRHDDHDPVWLN